MDITFHLHMHLVVTRDNLTLNEAIRHGGRVAYIWELSFFSTLNTGRRQSVEARLEGS
jgi:hypothetical protein